LGGFSAWALLGGLAHLPPSILPVAVAALLEQVELDPLAVGLAVAALAEDPALSIPVVVVELAEPVVAIEIEPSVVELDGLAPPALSTPVPVAAEPVELDGLGGLPRGNLRYLRCLR